MSMTDAFQELSRIPMKGQYALKVVAFLRIVEQEINTYSAQLKEVDAAKRAEILSSIIHLSVEKLPAELLNDIHITPYSLNTLLAFMA